MDSGGFLAGLLSPVAPPPAAFSAAVPLLTSRCPIAAVMIEFTRQQYETLKEKEPRLGEELLTHV